MMKIMNKLPRQLLEKQESQRQKTMNIVLRAIHDLKNEGYSIKIKDLIDYTGLSRSVFSKSHIRKILVDNKIVSPDLDASEKPSKVLSNQKKLKLELKEKDEYIKHIIDENLKLKMECELLRGRLFLLMQRYSII
jgi:hypothetical protein